MSYIPKSQVNKKEGTFTGIAPNGLPYLYPVPDAGNQSARVSLIVDVGTQERDAFEDKETGQTKEQKPVQQVVVFVDLVDQIVNYGGDIGEKQYRLLLNGVYDRKITGINFTAVPPRDADGNMVQGKLWTFHTNSLLTRLAKATGNDHILGQSPADNMDISALLGCGLYVDVQVKSTPDKNGKKDKDGNVIVYHNVKCAGVSKLPLVKGKPVEVEELQCTPMILNHDNITEETLPFIRGNVLEMMRKAPEWEGSNLQKLVGDKKETPQPVESEELSTQMERDLGEDFDEDDIPF